MIYLQLFLFLFVLIVSFSAILRICAGQSSSNRIGFFFQLILKQTAEQQTLFHWTNRQRWRPPAGRSVILSESDQLSGCANWPRWFIPKFYRRPRWQCHRRVTISTRSVITWHERENCPEFINAQRVHTWTLSGLWTTPAGNWKII